MLSKQLISGRWLIFVAVLGLLVVDEAENKEKTEQGKEGNQLDEIKKLASMALKFHETVGGGNITKTIAVGKKAFDRKKKIDKMMGKKEESPLKTAESVLKIGQKLGRRR